MFKNLVNKAKEKLEEQSEHLKKMKEKASEKIGDLQEGIHDLKGKATEKLSDLQEGIHDLKEKASDKLEETGDRLTEMKEKVRTGVETKGQELKEMKDKALNKLTLEHLLPEVRAIILAKVMPLLNIQTFGKALADEKREAVFRTAYEFLPAPIRLMVSQDTFISFCLSNRDKILDAETEKQLSAITVSKQHFSKADELLKLKELLDSGILTEEEFANLKEQLI